MTDIPLGARVECAGHVCGRATHAIINRPTQRVTHLVVRERGFRHRQCLVPIEQVKQTTRDVISLGCTKDELAAMEPFMETEYVQMECPGSKQLPHLQAATPCRNHWEWVPVKSRHIPPGGLAVRRGAQVQATDGRAGRVEELFVDPASGRITHLVMREGHSWALKDVPVPISEISRIGEQAVYLMLDKHSVESLPGIPVKRI